MNKKEITQKVMDAITLCDGLTNNDAILVFTNALACLVDEACLAGAIDEDQAKGVEKGIVSRLQQTLDAHRKTRKIVLGAVPKDKSLLS